MRQDTKPRYDICAACRADITQIDPDGGLWMGAAIGGNYTCPKGELHEPVARCTSATGHLNGPCCGVSSAS